ncbi:MAG TPA: NAD(P)H-binding protein [Polyangiaceae bacterium]|nr:NAD(P)H-binding protein [Polyangiaceae bacterium]
MNTDTNALVIGGSGGVGGALVQELLERGCRVRVSSRAPEAQKWPAGVEPVHGDLEQPASIRAAAAGIEAVFLYVQGRAPQIVKELRAAGVKRVTVLSTIDTTNDSPVAAYNRRRHLEFEEAVADAGFAFTCLRPGAFVGNALRFFTPQLATGNVVRLPFPDSRQAPIDVRDIARVAAIALTSERLDGQRPVLTGPDSLSQREQVMTLGKLLGRPLEIETERVEAARARLLERIPPRYVELLLGQWEEETRLPAFISPEVARITGRPPTAYSEALAWALAQRDS